MRGTVALVAILLVGCGTAPLSGMHTARSMGKGNSSVGIGSFVSGSFYPAILLSKGITDHLDLELQGEALGVGLISKYSVINTRSGLSWALFLSGGTLFTGGVYWYGGSVISVKIKAIEPFVSAKYVETYFLNASSVRVPGQVTIDLADRSLQYPLYSTGLAIWLSENIGILGEYSVFGPFLNGTASVASMPGMPWLGLLVRY